MDIYQDHQGPDPNVMALRNAGKEVICYFSTQYEDWRTDMRNLSEIERRLGQKLKGNVLDDWPGERFINTRSQAVRDLMQARMVRAKKMGCTGVEPDNVDFYSFTTGFRLTKADTIDYMRFLSNTAHRLDLKIALKNADAIAAQVEPLFDFAVVEECAKNDECGKYSSFIRKGKAVLQAEYRSFNPSTCKKAKNMGFSLIFVTNGTKKMNGQGIVPCK